MKTFTPEQLRDMLGGELRGECAGRILDGIATLQLAGPTKISFLTNPAYKKYLNTTRAGLVLLTREMADEFDKLVSSSGQVNKPVRLVLDNPYLGYARLSEAFDTLYKSSPGIHPTATVAPDVSLPDDVFVGAHAVIDSGCEIGAGVYVGHNVTIGADCRLGRGTRIWHGATLYDRVHIGDQCIIHGGTVLGSDGFGNANDRGEWIKIYQLGGVRIGNDVEIGSNCSIDRGALDDTVIEDGVRIDNLVQVAHNVHIGKHTAIAGCVGIAGSTRIGAYCVIGGACGIGGHLEIADHVHLTGMSMVTNSIREPGVYSSGTGVEPNRKWRRMVARLRNLDDMAKRLIKIEKQVSDADKG